MSAVVILDRRLEALIATAPAALLDAIAEALPPALSVPLADYRKRAEDAARAKLRELLSGLYPPTDITATGPAPVANITE